MFSIGTNAKSVQSLKKNLLPDNTGETPKGSSLDREVCCSVVVMTSLAPAALAHKCAGKTFASGASAIRSKDLYRGDVCSLNMHTEARPFAMMRMEQTDSFGDFVWP